MLPIAGCTAKHSFFYQTDPDVQQLVDQHFKFPDTTFFVLSDPHIYDTSLGTEGAAFKDYLSKDRKLLVLSDEIIGAATNLVAGQNSDFVLVCGDLTKDGEIVCHKKMVKHLKTLKNSGKKIFIIPGNHDLDNANSVKFQGSTTTPVPGAGPEEFKTLYHDFGFKDAIVQDDDSLSYIAEPVKGLRLFALDSCRWKENRPDHQPVTGGAFSQKTLQWIEKQLIAAKQDGKAVLVFMHHGIMEHYSANEKFYENYIVKDHKIVSSLFASYGVPLVFTGHFHAQDITKRSLKDTGRFVFDVETGSLATAPCPFRRVQISKGRKALINSSFIKSIPSLGDDFEEYAKQYVFDGTKVLVNTKLDKYMVSKDQQELINHQVSSAYTAHLRGDELKPSTIIDSKGFGLWLKFVAWMQEDLIDGWWTDLAPKDNNITIDLETGSVT